LNQIFVWLLDFCCVALLYFYSLFIIVPTVQVSDTTGDTMKNKCWQQIIFLTPL